MRAFLLAAVIGLAAASQPAPKPKVRLDTSYGPVVVELEPDLAPATVANFLAYVKEGHYAGTVFHRVIPGFMVQGGGLGEDLVPRPAHAPIPNEAKAALRAGLRNAKGTLAMARTEDPDSATDQFFINTADNPALDPRDGPGGAGYCVFGRVVDGMPAVARIEQVRTVWRRGMANVPEYPVRIKGAQLLAD
jgi:cyclophilin family peptidyl-prolyl cis-trans isomerase